MTDEEVLATVNGIANDVRALRSIAEEGRKQASFDDLDPHSRFVLRCLIAVASMPKMGKAERQTWMQDVGKQIGAQLERECLKGER